MARTCSMKTNCSCSGTIVHGCVPLFGIWAHCCRNSECGGMHDGMGSRAMLVRAFDLIVQTAIGLGIIVLSALVHEVLCLLQQREHHAAIW